MNAARKKGSPAGKLHRPRMDLVQLVQVRYHNQSSTRNYTYGWTGKAQLEVDDIVILPATRQDPGEHWILGYVVAVGSDYTGDVDYVLRAIRGHLLR